jgi:glycosyltransferase involved in cell wall biosynthesis
MRKRILHIQLLPLLSGVQNVMLHILQGLDQSEYEIYVACKPGGPLVKEVLNKGYTFLPLPLFEHRISPLDAAVFFQLFFLCRRYKFDIVHTHSSKPGLLGRIAARLAGVPLVVHTGHGAPFHTKQPLFTRNLFMTLEKFGARFCDKMVFVNNYHRNYYIEHNLIAPAKAVTIYNAISPELQEAIERKTSHRKLVGEAVQFGSILRFSEQKNIVMTISAAIVVCQGRKDVQFTFIGDGEYFELCYKLVTNEGLQDRILLPGWCSDTAARLSRFDVFMLYSDYEGLAMSVIEAMFAGLPVLASDIPANAELVDETTGWLVPAHQRDALVIALNKIIDARVSFVQKGFNGKKKAKELCSYDNFIREHLRIYRSKA